MHRLAAILPAILLVLLITAFPNGNCATETSSPQLIQKLHPKMFEMVTSWVSDTEEPVVTSINLDAVARNRNQFDFSKVKMNGEWTEYIAKNGNGFCRFKSIKSDSKRFAIEFQQNAGGTLTRASVIEFVIESQEIQRGDNPHTISVLRIVSVKEKLN